MGIGIAVWRKSSRSNESGDACIEVASISGGVAVRDSKDPEGPKIIVGRKDFRRFAEALRAL
ncbi:DUF397 domain-containing protein [Spirillospora albida]|uniref:DUF397 domain-containing protein n=1 Tax=Spirillospora albida TaxID=58123 RepID=UPI0009FCA04A|nr:DUF397 domain-containing protein [Spirillospora albida]